MRSREGTVGNQEQNQQDLAIAALHAGKQGMQIALDLVRANYTHYANDSARTGMREEDMYALARKRYQGYEMLQKMREVLQWLDHQRQLLPSIDNALTAAYAHIGEQVVEHDPAQAYEQGRQDMREELYRQTDLNY